MCLFDVETSLLFLQLSLVIQQIYKLKTMQCHGEKEEEGGKKSWCLNERQFKMIGNVECQRKTAKRVLSHLVLWFTVRFTLFFLPLFFSLSLSHSPFIHGYLHMLCILFHRCFFHWVHGVVVPHTPVLFMSFEFFGRKYCSNIRLMLSLGIFSETQVRASGHSFSNIETAPTLHFEFVKNGKRKHFCTHFERAMHL